MRCISSITIQQIERAIDKLSPQKAPGPDEIRNIVLKKSYDILKDYIHALVQALIHVRYFPAAFKTSTTIVLHKAGKPDYTKPNAYRPIALENTLGKLIESVIAELLSNVVESYELLPPQHFRGCPG